MTAPLTPVHHVAFDWGGVLTIGTFDGASTARVAEHTGTDVKQVRQSYFRHVYQLEVGHWSLPQFWEAVQRDTGLTLPYPEFEALYLGSINDNVVMYDLLACLPARVKVGLLSNNYPVVHDHLRARAAFGRFDALVFSNEIGVKKPDPQSFAALEAAMQRVDPSIRAGQVAFVDDVQENVDAASVYGFHGMLYHHEAHAAFQESLSAWLGVRL